MRGPGATGEPVNQGYAKLMQLEDDWQASCAYSAKEVMYRSVFIGFLSFLDGCCLIQSFCWKPTPTPTLHLSGADKGERAKAFELFPSRCLC